MRFKKQNIFLQILDVLSVKHTKEFSCRYFEEHPNKDNMYGLHQMLDDYNVDNVCLQLQVTSQSLMDLNTPFVAYFDGDFVIVIKITDKSVICIRNGNNVIYSLNEFEKYWSGSVLVFDASEKSCEPNYIEHLKSARLKKIKKSIFCLSLLFALCFNAFEGKFFSVDWFLLSFNFVGGILCFLLQRKYIYGVDTIADRVCSLLIHKAQCDEVINTSASKILEIHLSNIGLGYFFVNIMFLIISPENSIYMYLVNILVFPVAVWSIVYQKYKLKQWCSLCLCVQFCILLLAARSMFVDFEIKEFKMINLLHLFAMYIVVIFIFHEFSELLIIQNDGFKIKRKYRELKGEKDVFECLLFSQDKYEVDREIGIILGNKESCNMLTIVSNPHCNPCAKLHIEIDRILREREVEMDFCIQLILTSSDMQQKKSLQLFMAVYLYRTYMEFLDFLSEWYLGGRNNPSFYYEKYSGIIDNEQVVISNEKQKEWLHATNIYLTPTLLFNGFVLPASYGLEDIRFLYKKEKHPLVQFSE